MKYPYKCVEHDIFEIEAPISEGPPSEVRCPTCNEIGQRIYHVPIEIWHTDGSSRDYMSENPGRGQSWDKKEQLNKTWSKHFGTKPPPEDTAGTYDGIPRANTKKGA